MSHIHHSITELIGHTPLLELHNFEKNHNAQGHILAKLEYFNATGSVKDRAALRYYGKHLQWSCGISAEDRP